MARLCYWAFFPPNKKVTVYRGRTWKTRGSRGLQKAYSEKAVKTRRSSGGSPKRQIGLASIGLKVNRRDNKQEKLPVITGFNIFLFLCDPFLLSIPPFYSFFLSKDRRLKTDLLKLGLICNALWTLGSTWDLLSKANRKKCTITTRRGLSTHVWGISVIPEIFIYAEEENP